jgi:hypothetical protein
VPDLSKVNERPLVHPNLQVIGEIHRTRPHPGVSSAGSGGTRVDVKTFTPLTRFVATIFAIAVTLGVAGVGAATEAQAQPGPFPQWCPGEFWDPGWGDNWDWNGCHDWHGGPGGWDRDRGWDRDGPGWDHDHGGPGWDHDHGGPGWGGRGR